MRKTFILLLFILLAFFESIGLFMAIPIFADLFLQVGKPTLFLSKILLAIAIGSYSFAQLLGGIIIGKFSDYWGRKKALIFGIIVAVIGYFFLGLGISYSQLILIFFARFLLGLSSSNIAIIYAATVDLTEPDHGVNIGYLNGGSTIGAIVGPLTPFLFPTFHPAIPCYILSLCFLFLLFLLLFYYQEKRKHSTSPNHHIPFLRLFKQHSYSSFILLLFGIFFLFSLCTEGFRVAFSFLLVEKLGKSPMFLAKILSFGSLIAALFSFLLNRFLSKNLSSFKIFQWSILVTSIGYFLSLYITNSWEIWGCFGLIGGFSFLCWTHIIALISSCSDPKIRGLSIGFSHSILALAGIIGPFIPSFFPINSVSVIFSLIAFSLFLIFTFSLQQLNRIIPLYIRKTRSDLKN